MMQTTIDLLHRKVLAASNNVSLVDAKKWIDHRMILQKAWLGFAPGTRCRVMCVVDFGDGLLLWLVTDDEHVRDVDQLEIPIVLELFSDSPAQYTDNSSASNNVTIAQLVN